MNPDFSVSFERVNEREAMHGGTTRYGMADTGLTLREAVATVRGYTEPASEARGCYPSDSDPRQARWIGTESEEYETGDSVTLRVHFPRPTTPSSRARLCRVLAKIL